MTNSSFEKRSDRRDRLIGLLQSEYYWQTSDLREELGISQRTLMRELAQLRDAGYPIESSRGVGGGIRLDGRWGVGRINLNHNEVLELILSLAIVESLKSPLLTSNLKAIKQKLFQVFPENQRAAVSDIRQRIMVGDIAKQYITSFYRAPEQAISEPVATSFLQQKLLKIEYVSEAGERSQRVIEAQYLLLNLPIWYIIGWDHLRESSRVFRIDRIQHATILDERFKLREKHVFSGIYSPSYPPI
ncbi:helix-turn-helix transcriptional regulator [Reinekea thalattae]|uniref:WYL domain-containing protein n=1 Tax=Reinekea thalattae TaxID=2593301 RepID=A0A5C8ZA80_9GAMM|nr:WYL domain-containing protein [Reinekea thalattae]TXR54677.1 WYL domain-containing protein [Reinekea thalattae]